MSYNTREPVRTMRRYPGCALWRVIHRILRRPSFPLSCLKCFSYFQHHLQMGFHAALGTVALYFSALYVFNARLHWNSWKHSNRENNHSLLVRLVSTHSMTLVDTLLMLVRISGLRTITKRNMILFLFSLSYISFSFLQAQNIYGVTRL